MAVTDLWTRRDGSPSLRAGRGMRWRASWQGRSESYRTKRAAEAAELRMRTEPARRPQDTTTVGQLVDLWLEGKADLSAKGYEAAGNAAKHVKDEWGEWFVADLTSHGLQAWLAGVERSASWKHKVRLALRGACRIGIRVGAIERNPVDEVRVAAEKRREGMYLTVDQVRALADAGGGPMLWFLATTGVRIGEACALTVGDVDASRGRARIGRAKTKAGVRDVAIPAKVLAMLDLKRPGGVPLFTAPMGGRVHKDVWRARVFTKAVEKVGPEGLRPHDLRHTAASLMIRSGASVKDVQRQLGHAAAAMTLDVYSHLFDQGIDDVAGRLDAMV